MYSQRTYSVGEVAATIGIHPNTVRLYEALSYISKPQRLSNGYRVFTDLHMGQLRFARLALRAEILQHGLRKQALACIQLSAIQQFEKAREATLCYEKLVERELSCARSAITAVQDLMEKDQTACVPVMLTRKEAATHLGLTIDTLRNWELNGLLKVKRKQNGYRMYDGEDLKRLTIIRTLRTANYSLMAILRLLNSLDEQSGESIEEVLNTPTGAEDIISVCDRFLISLEATKTDIQQMCSLLSELQEISQPSTYTPEL